MIFWCEFIWPSKCAFCTNCLSHFAHWYLGILLYFLVFALLFSVAGAKVIITSSSLGSWSLASDSPETWKKSHSWKLRRFINTPNRYSQYTNKISGIDIYKYVEKYRSTCISKSNNIICSEYVGLNLVIQIFNVKTTFVILIVLSGI